MSADDPKPPDTLVLRPDPVALLSVEWSTTSEANELTYDLTVEGHATDRKWLAGALLQLAAAIGRGHWDWEEGAAAPTDPTPGDALPFRRPEDAD